MHARHCGERIREEQTRLRVVTYPLGNHLANSGANPSVNGLAIRWRNGLQRFDAAFHGGPRAVAPRSGSSVAVTRNCPPQCGQHIDSRRFTRHRNAATDSMIAGSGGGTASTVRAAASPTFFLAGESKPLPDASSDTRTLTHWALLALRRIYRPGYWYHKAGVTLMAIIPKANQQFSLFVTEQASNSGSEKLMDTVDLINLRYGRGTLRLAAEGLDRSWQMRRGNLSPAYTTSWEGLAVVRAR